MRLNRADVLLAYAYMEERNFPDIAACRVIRQAHEFITRAAEQVNAEGQVAENLGDHGLTGGEPVPSAPILQPADVMESLADWHETLAKAQPDGVVVPRERSYDARAKAIIAFNQASGDLDDKLEAAHQAVLLAAAKEPR